MAEFVARQIRGANLSNPTADRNGDAFGLELADSERQLHALLVVVPLLLVEVWLRQINKRRSVDIDVVEASGDSFASELLHTVHFRNRIDCELLRVDLELVALDEDRPAESLAQRGGDHNANVLGGAPICICDFRSRDLENKRTDPELHRLSEYGSTGVVGHTPDCPRRPGESATQPPAPRLVQSAERISPD